MSVDLYKELSIPHGLSEKDVLKLLAERIAALVQQGPDAFYGLMYRLDIPEKKLHNLATSKDAAMQVARLIYDRQLQKARSREYYRNNPLSTDEDELKW